MNPPRRPLWLVSKAERSSRRQVAHSELHMAPVPCVLQEGWEDYHEAEIGNEGGIARVRPPFLPFAVVDPSLFGLV